MKPRRRTRPLAAILLLAAHHSDVTRPVRAADRRSFLKAAMGAVAAAVVTACGYNDSELLAGTDPAQTPPTTGTSTTAARQAGVAAQPASDGSGVLDLDGNATDVGDGMTAGQDSTLGGGSSSTIDQSTMGDSSTSVTTGDTTQQSQQTTTTQAPASQQPTTTQQTTTTQAPAPSGGALPNGRSLAVEFVYQPGPEGRNAPPYAVIWIANANNGALVKTLKLWTRSTGAGHRWVNSLSRWFGAWGGTNEQSQAITSGTIQSNNYRAQWNGTNESGQVAPAGSYLVIIETRRENGDYNRSESGPVNFNGGDPGTISLPDKSEIKQARARLA